MNRVRRLVMSEIIAKLHMEEHAIVEHHIERWIQFFRHRAQMAFQAAIELDNPDAIWVT